MEQILQLVGAVLILIAFAAAQSGRMSPHTLVYLTLNLVGSVVLTGVALYDSDWGFLLLEVVWAIVSLWGIVQLGRGRSPSPAH